MPQMKHPVFSLSSLSYLHLFFFTKLFDLKCSAHIEYIFTSETRKSDF